MFETIGMILAIIIIFKLSLVAIKLFGKLLGALINVAGYLVLGGAVITLSLPALFIMVLLVMGCISIFSLLFVA